MVAVMRQIYLQLTSEEAVVMRGIPGSGKSTRTSLLLRAADAIERSRLLCSADSFFVDGTTGRYSFNPKLLGRAHASCFAAFKEGLAHGTSLIVVDNTSTKGWELKKDVDEALEAGYAVRVEELCARDDSDIKLFHNRGLHGVPIDKMRQMHARWEQLNMEHPDLSVISLEVRR